jgi:uncharacterized protein YkwD
MLRISKLVVALLLGASAGPLRPSPLGVASETGRDAAAKPARSAVVAGNTQPSSETAADIPFQDVDSGIAQRMLDLANQARAQAAAPPLTLDAGLSRAAQTHAEAMVAAGQLSHQFAGEPPLPKRLAATSNLLLERSGENVALDYDAAAAHQHLMLSPHHRENLLNPAYNVIGLGIARNGNQLYIVQDFGHALPNYSSAKAKDLIAASLLHVRSQAHQPGLQRRDLPVADDVACSMAQADRLGTSPIHQLAQRYTVLTYTTLQPQALPAAADRAVASPSARSFSVGACHSRTTTYPNGVYWVVVSLE